MAIRPVRTISRMPNGPHLLDEGLDFVFAAGDFDHHVLRADVDDAGPEDLGDLLDLRAAAVLRADFHQHQVAFDVILVGEVEDLDHGDDFFELLADLVEDAVVPIDDESHAGEPRILRRTDGQAVDVERPGGEHPGDMGQNAGLVHHQRGEDVSHARLTFSAAANGDQSV